MAYGWVMAKGRCLFFFRAGWRIFNKSPARGNGSSYNLTAFVHPNRMYRKSLLSSSLLASTETLTQVIAMSAIDQMIIAHDMKNFKDLHMGCG
jgi:hypothetical protein